MKYLIDTHILLWYLIGDQRIGNEVKHIVEDKVNFIFVSNASLWEIAIKVAIGKLKLKTNIIELHDFLVEKKFIVLNFDFEDLDTLLGLPFYHQDPFDRLIVAQSKTKSLKIISNDPYVLKYFN